MDDGDDDDETGYSEDAHGERMGQGTGVMGQSRTPNGDRLTVFTSQQE